MDIDTAVPLGLIINEIVTNTMKYAFKADKGKIYVDIKELDTKQFELKIGDNGAGIPKDFDIKMKLWKSSRAKIDKLGDTLKLWHSNRQISYI